MDLNNILDDQKYNADDIIYNIGANPDVFYILKAGRLVLETIIEVEDFNKYPIGFKKWEILKTKRQLLYKITDLKPGAIFGH